MALVQPMRRMSRSLLWVLLALSWMSQTKRAFATWITVTSSSKRAIAATFEHRRGSEGIAIQR